jgi:hypothetical protein
VANLPVETFRQSTTPVVPVAKFTADVVDTGCIFAAIVIDNGGAHGLVNISTYFRQNSK